MPFKRYVEIGRVAMINYGEDFGKLVVISDVVDQNRVLVDTPTTLRRVENFKRLTLTDLKVEIPRLARKKVLKEALEKADTQNVFDKSAWGQKLLTRKAKADMSDFDRYKAMVAKAKKARAVRKVFNQLKKAAK